MLSQKPTPSPYLWAPSLVDTVIPAQLEGGPGGSGYPLSAIPDWAEPSKREGVKASWTGPDELCLAPGPQCHYLSSEQGHPPPPLPSALAASRGPDEVPAASEEREWVAMAPKVPHSLEGRPACAGQWSVPPPPWVATGSSERPSPDSMTDSLSPSAARRQGPESIILPRLSEALIAARLLTQGAWPMPSSSWGTGRLGSAEAEDLDPQRPCVHGLGTLTFRPRGAHWENELT